MSEIQLFICIKMDLALNNPQWLICHKTKPNQTKTIAGIIPKMNVIVCLLAFSLPHLLMKEDRKGIKMLQKYNQYFWVKSKKS